MATWHRLGDEAELRARAPLALKIERHRIAIFHHDGQFRAISDICNHRGGPLSDGRVRGEFLLEPHPKEPGQPPRSGRWDGPAGRPTG
jgi:nitrite reductase/ring-hydroxylating ferredoxin subunit